LVATGKKGKAIKYAQASCGFNDNPVEIDRVCEEILLSSGLYDEAYRQYGLSANMGATNLSTFRNIAKKEGYERGMSGIRGRPFIYHYRH
jgi:hypothetical protein